MKLEVECRALVCDQWSLSLPRGCKEPEAHQPVFPEIACAAQGCNYCKDAFEDVFNTLHHAPSLSPIVGIYLWLQ